MASLSTGSQSMRSREGKVAGNVPRCADEMMICGVGGAEVSVGTWKHHHPLTVAATRVVPRLPRPRPSLTEGIYSCLFHIPATLSTGPAIIPTRHTADRTRLSRAARSSRISATSLDREYPIAADADTRSTGDSGAVPLAMDATVDTLDTNSTRALCRDAWASWIRSATPWMCGRKDCSGQLKFTGHWLSGERQL